MSCKDKNKFRTSEASSKAALRTAGIIDEFLHIKQVQKFRETVRNWNDNARQRFGITERLFTEQNGKAVPNSEAFKTIDKINIRNEKIAQWKDRQINQIEAQELIDVEIARGQYTEDNRGEFYQLNDSNSPNTDLPIQELDNYLLDFLKPFGVKSKEFDSLKEKLGIDAFGATDVLNKLIWITKNRNVETVPEEFGHMAVMLMGEHHKDIKELLANIQNWSEYENIKKIYLPIYKDENKVKVEAIGKLIAKALVKNYKAHGVNETLLEKALFALRELIKKISDNFLHAMNTSEYFADKVAINILLGRNDYIGNLYYPQRSETPKVNYEDAISKNPLAQNIISTYGKGFGNVLTGSLAIAGQKEDVYRDSDEPIHDLDFIVDGRDDSKVEAMKVKLKEQNAIPAHLGWSHNEKGYTTYAYLIPKNGLTIENVKRGKDGFIVSYELRDASNNIVERNSQNIISVDFFLYTNNSPQIRNVGIFNSWQDIFNGKLGLSRAKNPLFFAREKDQLDYLLIKPKNRTLLSNPAFIYYQLEETQTNEIPSSQTSPETLEKVKQAAQKMGIDIQSLSDYAKETGLDTKSINGVADLVKGVIAVAHGMEDVTLTEEMVHIATSILEQTNPKLVTELISKIDRFKIYKQTLEAYKGNKNYQLSNGKPDIRKIKKEAVDKLIAEVIVNQSENTTQFPELMEQNNTSLIQGWWNTIKDYIRGVYRKTNIDIFNQAGEKIISGETGNVSDLNGKPNIQLQLQAEQFTANEIGENFKSKEGKNERKFNRSTGVSENFKLLQREGVNQYSNLLSTERNTRTSGEMSSRETQSIPYYKGVFGRSFNGVFSSEKRGTDMEGTARRFSNLRVIQSLNENKFLGDLARRLGVDEVRVVTNKDNISNSPLFTDGKYIYINEDAWATSLEEKFQKGINLDEYVDVAVFEELIHITAKKLYKKSEFLEAELELKAEERLLVDKFYNDTNPQSSFSRELDSFNRINELIRMKVQKDLIGKSTEDLANTSFIDDVIHRIWDFIMDVFKTSLVKSNKISEDIKQYILSNEKLQGNSSSPDILGLPLLQNDKVDSIYNIIVETDKRMQLHPETVNDKRHYTIDGERIAKSVTEKAKDNKKMPERSDEDKVFDNQKKEWGIEGHRLLETYISTNLIDKDGYALKQPLNTPISSVLNDKQQQAIQEFAKELISSYKEGTRFLVERMVVNEKEKGKLASTMDFVAIEPQENGEAKVDVLDWKFTDINKNKTEDIPWFKEKEWKLQMGEYSKILYNYGVKPSQLRRARMIPFIMNYVSSVKGNFKSPLVPSTIEIGKLDSLTETKMYLLPVPVNTESTGNELIDSLLEALRTQWEKLYNKTVSPEERGAKDIQLNQMRKAIRSLQLRLNFEELANVGKTFLKNTAVAFKEFENVDYSILTKEETQKKLGDLLEYRKSAEKFATLDEVYLSHVSKTEMSETDKKTLLALEQISANTKRMFGHITKIQKDFVVQLALLEEVTTEETKLSVIEAEKAIDGFSKTFLESSKLSAKIIQLATRLMLNAQSLVNRKVGNKIKEYQTILLPLQQEANGKGVSAFSLIGQVSEKGLKLTRKVSREFWDEIAQAKKERKKQFFLDNMDKEKFNELSKQAIEKGTLVLNNMQFSSEQEDDDRERQYRINKLVDSVDINSKTFNGYDGFQFSYLFNQCVILEGHYSQEYMNMSEQAKAVWQFFTSLNEQARKMGYLDKQGSSFFPLMEATILEKFSSTSNLALQTKDFFQDFYKTRINEEQNYSKIDPETGQLKRIIPKYFTKTDKKVEQLSTDLTKVGAMWVKALYEYENARNMENTLLTLHSVEATKGSLMTDQNKHVITEGGKPKVNKLENHNADILQTIVEDFLYDLREDVNSMGNVGIGAVTSKFSKDQAETDEKTADVKKVLSNMDTLVRVLGVGLKPLIAIANWSGGQFQAFINSGNMYRFGEFEKNNLKITTGTGLSTLEKGLLHMIIPLNEDVAVEGQRKIAKKESLIKFLGTWSFTDVMMITNSFPERKLQYANALSFIENSMVVNGKILNIRQYVKAMDRKGKYSMSQMERKELENTYEKRVTELKEEKSLNKIAKIINDEVVIEGVTEEELAKYRVKIIEYNRQLNGQMSSENKAGYRRDTILRSFMMFKTWIPKLVSSRALDIHKNIELDEWEYGRMRVFFKTWAQLGARNIFKMRSIIQGTEEGLKILDDMLQAKQQEYLLKTGKQLEITKEEFYDLIREELSKEMKEIGLLFGVMGMLLAAKAAKPPEDATDYEKNHYKFLAKAINKISDEVSFYYSPLSFSQITQGNIMPSLNLLVKAYKFIGALGKETTGYIIDDEDMVKKAHPTKYFLNMIPGAAQFNSEVLPYIFPEMAKEQGIIVTTESRR